MNLDKAKDRVIKERLEVRDRLRKLQMFLGNTNLHKLVSNEQLELMREQEKVMDKYLNILTKRLDIWQDN